MSERPKADVDTRATSYTIDHIPLKVWGQFKLLCHQQNLTLRAGVLMALAEYIQARNELLTATLEEWAPASPEDAEGEIDAGGQP